MYRYYRKRIRYLAGFRYYRSRGADNLPVCIDGITVLLSFDTPYHYEIVRSLRAHPEADLILISWMRTEAGRYYDIGAFSGIYGLLAAKAHPSSTVLIFEPDPINAQHIRKNIELNGLRNCELVEAAVSDVDGTVHFNAQGKTDGRISDTGTPVKAISLSSLPPADLIKLDVEGAELRVLQGMNYKGVVMLELHPSKLGVSEQDFWRIVKDKGYRAWFIDYQRGTGGEQKHYLLF